MATIEANIAIEIDDALVVGLPAARENIEYYIENAIRNRLFGEGFLPDDIEVDEWSIRMNWRFPAQAKASAEGNAHE